MTGILTYEARRRVAALADAIRAAIVWHQQGLVGGMSYNPQNYIDALAGLGELVCEHVPADRVAELEETLLTGQSSRDVWSSLMGKAVLESYSARTNIGVVSRVEFEGGIPTAYDNAVEPLARRVVRAEHARAYADSIGLTGMLDWPAILRFSPLVHRPGGMQRLDGWVMVLRVRRNQGEAQLAVADFEPAAGDWR